MAASRTTDTSDGKLSTTERLFRIAVTIKGLDGGLQFLGALLLIVIKPSYLAGLAQDVITRDLLGAQNGPLAHHFELATESFVHGNTRVFAIFYLGLHGLIKLGLVWALLKKIRPAYPIGMVVLAAFVLYELYRTTQTHSVLLPIFAAIDIVIIVLIYREYRALRHEPKPADAADAETP